MAIKIWYEVDGAKFDSLEAACEYMSNHASAKPPVFMDRDGSRSEEYNDDTVICIFYDINNYNTWLERAEKEDNGFNEGFPHKDEMPDFLDQDGYIAVYWNDWLEEWEWYCWEELSGNYKKGRLINEVLKVEGLENDKASMAEF